MSETIENINEKTTPIIPCSFDKDINTLSFYHSHAYCDESREGGLIIRILELYLAPALQNHADAFNKITGHTFTLHPCSEHEFTRIQADMGKLKGRIREQQDNNSMAIDSHKRGIERTRNGTSGLSGDELRRYALSLEEKLRLLELSQPRIKAYNEFIVNLASLVNPASFIHPSPYLDGNIMTVKHIHFFMKAAPEAHYIISRLLDVEAALTRIVKRCSYRKEGKYKTKADLLASTEYEASCIYYSADNSSYRNIMPLTDFINLYRNREESRLESLSKMKSDIEFRD